MARACNRSTALPLALLSLACGPDEADPSWAEADFAYLAPIAGVSTQSALAVQLGSSSGGEPLPIDPIDGVTSNEIAWSPWGDAIAYVIGEDASPYPAEPPQLWIARPGGSELAAELHASNGFTRDSAEIAWSPSGTHVLVRVYTYESAGSSRSGAHSLLAEVGAPIHEFPEDVWPGGSGASWSPDGKRFVATHTDHEYDNSGDPISETTDLYVYDLDAVEIIWPELNTAADERGPSWSPSGDAIAYIGNVSGTDEVLSWPTAGGDPVRIASAPCHAYAVEWFQDASRLVVGCSYGEAIGFAVLDAITGTVIVSGDEAAGSPSPDGRYLSVSRIMDGAVSLGLLDLDTQDTTTIGPGWSLEWRPQDESRGG